MTSLSAVVSITVVLLGGPQWFPGAPLVSQSMVIKGPGGVIEIPAGDTGGRRLPGTDIYLFPPSPLLGSGVQLSGAKTMHDTAAGLTTILGPSEGTIKRLFEEGVRSEADVQKATVEVDATSWHWPARDFEFLWPQDRPQYYLEQVEPDLYRRIELVDKEGYTVSVRPIGRPDELAVEVEFASKTLSGGKYDETIRAFVGRPTLIKAIVTATAPLTKGQKTLLVWEPSSARASGGGGRILGDLFGALGAAPTVQVLETARRPTGVAVLLEVTAPRED